MATILILDDRATNRNIYARLAAAIEDGVSAEVFSDPADALEWLESNRVDLVITDYKMPGMDGAEFTRRFRAMPNNRQVPVVVITAYDDRSFRLRALDAGATDFLQSPVDHFEIVVRARNLLALNRRLSAAANGSAPAAAPAPRAEAAATGAAGAPAPTNRDAPAVAGGTAAAAADLRRILDAVPAMISATDREGRCIFANAAAASAATAGTAANTPAAAGRARWRDLAIFEGGRPVSPFSEDAPGGGGRRLLTTKVPLRDAAGAVVAVLTTSFELPPAGEPAEEAGPAAPGAG